MNKLHNAFRMGQEEYPKTLTSAYYLEINCKGDILYVSSPPNYGVYLVTD